mgnify:CR=1 FL=1
MRNSTWHNSTASNLPWWGTRIRLLLVVVVVVVGMVTLHLLLLLLLLRLCKIMLRVHRSHGCHLLVV